MARTIARLQVATLEDPDFQALTINAQWTYWIILQQQRLTLAGSIDLRPSRWATAATNANADQITEGITELVEHRYVIVDDDTEELLVRTFVRHDLDTSRLSKNTIKGFWSAWAGIYSADLRAAVVAEIDDDLWGKLGPLAPVEAENIHAAPPVTTDTATPVRTGTVNPVRTGTDPEQETPRSTPFERETPPPSELPVDCPLSTVDTGTQVVSPPGLGTDPPDPTTDDDDEKNPDRPDLDQLARQVAQARSVRLGGGHKPGWIRAVTAGIDRDDLARALQITDNPAGIDQLLDGATATDPQATSDPTPVHPAIHAAHQPPCPTCDGLRWIDTADGTATPCPDCTDTGEPW